MITQPPVETGAFRMTAPDWLLGVWRRESIRHADGSLDDTTPVFWLQTRSRYADIRIPLARSKAPRPKGVDDLTAEAMFGMARQEGFAGHIELRGLACRWHRQIDYQPQGGMPDAGILALEGDILVERGVHVPYVEHWRRLEGSRTGPFLVLRKTGREDGFGAGLTSSRPLLLLAGDHFIYVRNRPHPLPAGRSLLALLDSDCHDRNTLRQWFDCEISYGCRMGGTHPWEIRLSTLPWREGQAIFHPGPVDLAPMRNIIRFPGGDEDSALAGDWVVEECSLSLGDLEKIFTEA